MEVLTSKIVINLTGILIKAWIIAFSFKSLPHITKLTFRPEQDLLTTAILPPAPHQSRPRPVHQPALPPQSDDAIPPPQHQLQQLFSDCHVDPAEGEWRLRRQPSAAPVLDVCF